MFGKKKMVERFRRYWADTIGHTEILNICCDLDLEHSNPIFPQDTLAYDAVLSNQIWLQTDQLLRNTTEIDIFQL